MGGWGEQQLLPVRLHETKTKVGAVAKGKGLTKAEKNVMHARPIILAKRRSDTGTHTMLELLVRLLK